MKIKDLEKTTASEKKKLKCLKDNAAAQQRTRKKKKEKLEKENIVEIYGTPGRPSFLINEPQKSLFMRKQIVLLVLFLRN